MVQQATVGASQTRLNTTAGYIATVERKLESHMAHADKATQSQITNLLSGYRQVAKQLESVEHDVGEIRLNQEYRPEVLQERVEARINQARATIENQLTELSKSFNTLVNGLGDSSLPTRPESDKPELQEARLAGLKADVKMVLDGRSDTELVSTMAAMAEDFASTGDELGTWLLTSSPWPKLYFSSRNPATTGMQLTELRSRLPWDVLMTEDQRRTWQLLESLTGSDGMSFIAHQFTPLARQYLRDLEGRRI